MKIELLKNWKNPAGKEISKGTIFTVVNELATELIEKKVAKKYKRGIISLRKTEPETEDKGQ